MCGIKRPNVVEERRASHPLPSPYHTRGGRRGQGLCCCVQVINVRQVTGGFGRYLCGPRCMVSYLLRFIVHT